tara:strand:+ start:90 stop:356 length:267 start_codon:yes stop_codon:yes gene_type:complete
MKKSNKRGKKASNSKDLDTNKEIKRMPLGKGFRTIVKDSMIDRKATQEEINKDKNIKRLLDVGAYNLNQIAGMLMLPLERVKKVKNER